MSFRKGRTRRGCWSATPGCMRGSRGRSTSSCTTWLQAATCAANARLGVCIPNQSSCHPPPSYFHPPPPSTRFGWLQPCLNHPATALTPSYHRRRVVGDREGRVGGGFQPRGPCPRSRPRGQPGGHPEAHRSMPSPHLRRRLVLRGREVSPLSIFAPPPLCPLRSPPLRHGFFGMVFSKVFFLQTTTCARAPRWHSLAPPPPPKKNPSVVLL